MKFFKKVILSLVIGVALLAAPVTTAFAEGSACQNCGSPTALRPVGCTLVRLHFTQPETGSVAIRLYDESGEVIYDRYSRDRSFIKQMADDYAICEGTVAQAHKVTITRCVPDVAEPLSFDGDVLVAFRRSEQSPIRLP